jgi:hypothetical protein
MAASNSNAVQARPRPTSVWREILIAIVAVLVIAVALKLSKVSRTTDELPPIDQVVATLPAAATSTEWRQRPWAEFQADHPLSSRGRAVRVGALIIELEAVAMSGDSTAGRLAGQVSKLLDAIPNGNAVGNAYRALADAEALADSAKRAEAARAAETLAGSTNVRLGAWLEAGRIAAAHNDTAFFSRPDTWTTLWVARGAAGEDANTRASVTVLSAYIAEPRRDSRRIAVALDALLRALAN